MDIKKKEIMSLDREILDYINNNDRDCFDGILNVDTRTHVMLALSDIRRNIVSWYPFEKGCSVLEIGADYGQITGVLCQSADKVVAFEENREKREAILKRYEDFTNLLVVDSVEGLKEKFDYITLIGLEEITDNIQEIFQELKSLLKADGKLLIAVNNKFSAKNFSTNDGMEKMLENGKFVSSLDKIIDLLKLTGFKGQKIYYPLTDYKFTNAIFTDDVKFSKSELSRNIVYNADDTIKFFEENEFWNRVFEEELDIKHFLNSFFIEVFNGDYVDNGIRLVTFSNMRKNKYRIKTIMTKDFVYKYPDNEESKEHIQNVKNNIDVMIKSKLKTIDSYDNEKIISKFVEGNTFDRVIVETAKMNKSKALELIIKFKQMLFDSFETCSVDNNVFDKYSIKYDKEVIKNMNFIKCGLWDLIFQNCFYIDDDFYFYDQEWCENGIPIEFILYRAAKYFIEIREYISLEELYEVLDIDSDKIKIFDELDNKIQEQYRNDIIWQMQKKGKNIEELRIQKLTDNHTINLLNMEIQNKNSEIDSLKAECEKLRNEINVIYNSKSWKITEPFRKIRRELK